MENPKLYITCRTCLGHLDTPKNLFDAKYKKLLQLLHSILGFQIKERIFKICNRCETKLKSVLKFKALCERSLDNFVNLEFKEEPIDDVVDNSNLLYNHITNEPKSYKKQSAAEVIGAINLKADHFDWNADSIQSNSESGDSFRYDPIKNDAEEEAGGTPSKRGVRLDQFPRSAVLASIAECRSFFTKAKHKTCLHCSYVGKTARGLSVHMSFMHGLLAKTWCYQCNVQTRDLANHKKIAQCFEFFCKFCGKFACPIKRATEHLRFHCSKESFDDALSKRGLWHRQFNRKDVLRAIAEHKSYFTDARSTSCLHCDYIGETARGLSIHMSTLHREDAKNWCYRCNMQTIDIEVHKNSIKCFLYFCKFCDKYACLIKHATTHLESHCHGLSSLEENDDLFNENSSSDKDDDIETIVTNKEPKLIEPNELNYSSSQEENTSFNLNTNVSKDDNNISVLPLKEFTKFDTYPHEAVEKALKNIMKPFYTTRQCPVCDEISLNQRHLQKHVRLKHRDLKNTWCFRCNSLEDDLLEHCKIHKDDLFRCVFCEKSFDLGDEIKNHIVFHSESSEKELKAVWFNCKYCPNSFQQEADFEKHKCPKITLPGVRIKYQRNFKVKKFKDSSSSKLKSKRKKTKCEDKRITTAKLFKKCSTKKLKETQLCSICGKVVSRIDFKGHMKIHNGTMFKCSHCDKQFTHKIYLIEHERRHTGEKPFLCGACGKAFITSSECKRHERIHEGGPQQCPICDVQCNRPERLKLHMKRHTGENKFSCAHCGISFHIKSLLLKHIKTHSDERPYKCSFCDNYFKHREEVTVHERNHTGVRPYACTLCPFTSTRSKELTNHMKKHPEDAPRANTPYKCQMCTKKFSTNAMLVSHTKNQHEQRVN